VGFLITGLGWFEGGSDATRCEFGVDQSILYVGKCWNCGSVVLEKMWAGMEKRRGNEGGRGEGWFGS